MNFNIAGWRLKQLVRLSKERGMGLKTGATLVFEKGLEALSSIPFLPEVPLEVSLTSKEEAWVLQNMPALDHIAMGTHLGVTPKVMLELRRKIREKYISAHWQTESDGEIGRKLGMSYTVVLHIRCALGLHHARGWSRLKELTNPNSARNKINRSDLEHALTKGGLTLVDYVRAHNLGITRERMRQLADELEVRQDRSPLWYATRWGIPELAGKAWLEHELHQRRSMRAVADAHRLHVLRVAKMVTLLGIPSDLSGSRGGRSQVKALVEVTCAACGKTFNRRPSQLRRSQKISKSKKSFCSVYCSNKTH